MVTVTKKRPGKAKTAAKQENKLRMVTPVGRIVYPFLLEPDEGRQYSDSKFKVDIIFPKETWKEQGAELRQAVLKVAAEFYGKPMKFSEFVHPFKDGDAKEKDYLANSYYMTCKSQLKPAIVGPDRVNLSEDRVKQIKGGDFARLVVSIYPYTQGEGGVTCGLDVLQFSKEGEALTGGRSVSINMLDDLEVELEDLDVEVEEEEDNYVAEDEMDDITI